MKQALFLLVLIPFIATAQRKITPTDSFSVTGKIKTELHFDVAQLQNFTAQNLKDQVIYNH